jgi:5,10-methylene-tetrahydrofolate dehydrogenase/methenyl tetrahydrofolate cyclohydrolase
MAWNSQVPGLAVLIVGERKDSQAYVRMKRKACTEVGMRSVSVDLPADASEETVLDHVLELNANPEVQGLSFFCMCLVFSGVISLRTEANASR